MNTQIEVIDKGICIFCNIFPNIQVYMCCLMIKSVTRIMCGLEIFK